jgi:excisionase family DNA binding protein
MPRVKSLDEVAQELGIHRRTLQRWIYEGKLTPYRIEGDRRRYLDIEEVERLREPKPLRRKEGEPGRGEDRV